MEDTNINIRARAGWVATGLGALTILVFFLVFEHLSPRYNIHDLNLFGEHIKGFQIVNPSAQKLAYFVSAFTALLLALSFSLPLWDSVLRKVPSIPSPPKWISELEKDQFRLDGEHWFSTVRASFVLYVLVFLSVSSVGFWFSSNISYQLLSVADPHIYYVSQELGEAIKNGDTISPQMMTAYGVGQSLIYVLGTLFVDGPRYIQHIVTGKIFNLSLVAAFLLLCYKVSWSQSGKYFPSVLMLFAFLLCMSLLGIYINRFEVISNLSAIRYTPLICLLLMMTTFDHSSSVFRDILFVALASWMAVLFPDTGTFCLLSLFAFLITDRQLKWSLVPRIVSFVFVAMISMLACIWFFRELFNVDIAAFYLEMAARFGKNYGGASFSPSWGELSLPFLAVSCFFYYVYQAFRKPLEGAERVAVSLAACFILMLMYYVNRPSESYWVFGILLLIPLHLVLNDIFRFSDFRIKQVAFFGVYYILGNLAFIQYEFSVKQPLRTVPFKETTEFQGVNIETRVGDFVSFRIAELRQVTVNRPNTMVFSTTPTAISALDGIDLPPQEIVFKNNNAEALELTIENVERVKPSYLIFEENWYLGYAWYTARPVIDRLVRKLAHRKTGSYVEICRMRYWIVYSRLDTVTDDSCPYLEDPRFP